MKYGRQQRVNEYLKYFSFFFFFFFKPEISQVYEKKKSWRKKIFFFDKADLKKKKKKKFKPVFDFLATLSESVALQCNNLSIIDLSYKT